MKWIKKGRIYKPRGNKPWAMSHAQVPLVEQKDEKTLRIYYGTRDEMNRTLTSFIEVDAANPSRIVYEHAEPILLLGAPGFFDDSGVMPSDVVTVDGRKYLFYVGWNTGHTARYRTALGLAISEDGGKSFAKVGAGPVMDRDLNDPVGVSCQSVLVANGVWKTWYMSYKHWQERNGVMEPFYEIKYAESKDGISWQRDNTTCIAIRENEGGIARPSVIHENGIYKIWYSVRGKGDYRKNANESYRIGYAESGDGIHWERMDHLAGIDISADGWDSEMVAYPYVFRFRENTYMFYNGNGFGNSGLGYAKLER